MTEFFQSRIQQISYFLFVLFLGALYWGSHDTIYSYDIFWHIKNGADFLYLGLNPFVDHSSFTHNGQWIQGSTTVFDILGGHFAKTYGLDVGLVHFRFLLWSLPVLLFLILSQKHDAHPIDNAVALSLLTSALLVRKLIRPELISHGFFIIFAWVLFNPPKKIKYLVGLIFLQILWVNLHASSVFGFVFLAGIYFQLLLDQLRSHPKKAKDFVILLGMGLVTVAAGFINPDGQHPILTLFHFDPRWSQWIIEFQAKEIVKLPVFFHLSIGLSLVSLVWLVIKRKIAAAFVLMVFVTQTFQVNKIFPHLAVLNAMLVFYITNESRKGLSGKKLLIFNRSLVGVATLVTLLFVVPEVQESAQSKESFDPVHYPMELVDPSQAGLPRGRIFNEYDIGGFLSYHFYPQAKVFIDGRTNILYKFDHFKNYLEATEDVEAFKRLNEKHDFDQVIARLSRNSQIIDTALASKDFGIAFVGAFSAVLSKIDKSPYPKSSFYFRFPQCLKGKKTPQLVPEMRLAARRLPLNSQLRLFHKTLVELDRAKDKTKYITESLNGPNLYGSTHRLLAYKAIEVGQPKLALSHFSKIAEKQKPLDQVAIDRLVCQFKKCNGVPESPNPANDPCL